MGFWHSTLIWIWVMSLFSSLKRSWFPTGISDGKHRALTASLNTLSECVYICQQMKWNIDTAQRVKISYLQDTGVCWQSESLRLWPWYQTQGPGLNLLAPCCLPGDKPNNNTDEKMRAAGMNLSQVYCKCCWCRKSFVSFIKLLSTACEERWVL